MWVKDRAPDWSKYTGRISLTRTRIDRYGYDSDGRYFGVGEPVFCVASEDDDAIYHFIRAKDRSMAKQMLRFEYPNAIVDRSKPAHARRHVKRNRSGR